MTKTYESWGRYPSARHEVLRIEAPTAALPIPRDGRSVLPFGLGRSYGDSCLNDQNCLIDTEYLNNFWSFDRTAGVLRAESGVSLAEILKVVVPHGWFLPVSPGTKFVTLGGAIANDIHGKNHHRAGTFGRHVRALGLLRSDGSRYVCSPTENPDLFNATIGGLGLTGLIAWVELQLHQIPGPFLHTATIRFRTLDEFFDISAENDSLFECNVSWVDCTSRGPNLGRGLFMAGNFSEQRKPIPKGAPKLHVPINAPGWLLNPLSIKSFNFAYYNKQQRRRVDALTYYEPFFYPLDAILHWNRMYGSRGFFQYQLVVPYEKDRSIIKEIFEIIASSGRASFLAVLKTFGDIPSPGMLSFPRPGVTLALDFPNEGTPTLRLMEKLDSVVLAARGALYPGKDARMSREMFQSSFPRVKEFSQYIDPRFSSSFWRRIYG
jgi:FAD/FMN-containing dehydrogenase